MATLLIADDVARKLGVSSRQVNRLVRDGTIPHVRLPSGEIRFRSVDIEKWLDSLQGVTA